MVYELRKHQLGHSMNSLLKKLRDLTTVVADTGDIEAIQRYRPIDATTNPSLLLKAAKLPIYKDLVSEAIRWSRRVNGSDQEMLSLSADKLAVMVGKEILNYVPGRISTEVSAALSFDTAATILRAQRIVDMYNESGIVNDRILIKIAGTWEGIRAAETLEKSGIQCNVTLLFGFEQAVACANVGVFLISPFVGRIYDWYKSRGEFDDSLGDVDPGVLSVKRIFNYYKTHGFDTIVMGASFRNTNQILKLAGCDRLTISPQLLEELEKTQGDLPKALSQDVKSCKDECLKITEQEFRWSLNENAMVTEKLSEGIRGFYRDEEELFTVLKALG